MVMIAQPRSRSPGETLLIFTHGDLNYTPHQLVIRTLNDSKTLTGRRRFDGSRFRQQELEEDARSAVRTIETRSHIIGINLSPQQDFLYVNCRPWACETPPADVLPEISNQILLRVYDLATCTLVRVHRGHEAFTPNDACFFIFLDVADTLVARSGPIFSIDPTKLVCAASELNPS